MKKHLIPAIVLAAVLALSASAEAADSLQLAQITPEHGFLERMAGRWNAMVRMWPKEGDTTAVQEMGGAGTFMAMNGRFLTESDSAHVGDSHYADMAWLGYNHLKHKFEVVWADNRHTDLLMLTGALNDSGNVLTLQGEREDSKNKKTSEKFIFRSLNGNYRILEVFETRPTGKERKIMEIDYVRGK